MSATYDVAISAVDPLNLGFGYSIRVTDSSNGKTVLFTDKDPATGIDLLTLRDALRVAACYEASPNR